MTLSDLAKYSVTSSIVRSLCESRASQPNQSHAHILATFLWQKLPAFDKVDRVERVHLWRQCRRQQSVGLDFAASVYGRATK